MSLSLHRSKLTIAGFVLTALFVGLGLWQLQRASENQTLTNNYMTRMKTPPATLNDFKTPDDWRFRTTTLTGQFDNAHTILLDNKTSRHQVGYEVYTPFTPDHSSLTFLVDRGFIPATGSRDTLPTVPAAANTATIIGLLNLPPRSVTLGNITEPKQPSWPLRVEALQLNLIGGSLNTVLVPYVLLLSPNSPYAFDIEWKMTNTTPNQNRLYAAQWFALALTLLVLSLALNRKTVKKSRKR